METLPRDLTSNRGFWFAVFALLSLTMVAGGLTYYKYEEKQILQEKYQDLAGIAELKARHITEQLQELLDAVTVISCGPLWRKAVADFVKAPDNPDLASTLIRAFEFEQKSPAYAEVLLFDPGGQTLLSLKREQADLLPTEKKAIDSAFSDHKAVLSDLFRVPDKDDIYLDAAAPVLDDSDRPLAILLLRVDANEALYPLVRSWPTPSPTAETLLVEVKGEDVLFLNDLRHGEKTALSMKRSLNQTARPAVQAALGKTGMFEGKDYRNKEVLADLRPIPLSPWFMVTKVDEMRYLPKRHTGRQSRDSPPPSASFLPLL